MATIVDSLLVTLGLNATEFHKQVKEVTRQQKQLKDNAKRDHGELSSAVSSLIGLTTKLFLGFEGAKAATVFFGNLNAGQADLGRFARNLGSSAREVSVWDNAVELAGGTAADANKDLQNLSASITALKTTGEVSGLLMLFNRMGVSLKDQQGRARSLGELYLDLGNKLRAFNRADAANLARQAGLSDSTLNFILQERDARAQLLQSAEANNRVTDASIAKAQELQQHWRTVKQELEGVAVEVLENVTPGMESAVKASEGFFARLRDMQAVQTSFKVFNALLQLSVDLLRVLGGGFKYLGTLWTGSGFGQWVDKEASKLWAWLKDTGKGTVAVADQIANAVNPDPTDKRPRWQRNNNPGNLRYAHQAGAVAPDQDNFATFLDMAQGIAAARRQLALYRERGLTSVNDIVSKWAPTSDHNDTAAYIKDVAGRLGVDPAAQLGPEYAERLLAAILHHESGYEVAGMPSAGRPRVPPLGVSSLASAHFAAHAGGLAGGAAPAPSGSTVTNTLHVGTIQVNAPHATDAEGIADDISDALQRRGLVQQANTGMQ